MQETDDIGQRVERLFWNYNSPKDLSLLSEQKISELAHYSARELYGRDFQRARLILKAIGAPSLHYLFSGLENNSFNHVYDIIMYIATKGKEAEAVARKAVGKIHSNAIRPEIRTLIMETGKYSSRCLIYALGDDSEDSVAGYAEELLRELHADERYTNIVKQELERALNPDHTYKDLSRERAKVILETV